MRFYQHKTVIQLKPPSHHQTSSHQTHTQLCNFVSTGTEQGRAHRGIRIPSWLGSSPFGWHLRPVFHRGTRLHTAILNTGGFCKIAHTPSLPTHKKDPCCHLGGHTSLSCFSSPLWSPPRPAFSGTPNTPTLPPPFATQPTPLNIGRTTRRRQKYGQSNSSAIQKNNVACHWHPTP